MSLNQHIPFPCITLQILYSKQSIMILNGLTIMSLSRANFVIFIIHVYQTT
ncbi:hypothetical protein Pint_20687 [Pistacia integerrima]|uniref:Uncharacterized protein n=1 Tax=Pistacia integerrima TaxID=434235 RepID=A0ACC0XFQ2_9ROSI|nr:hypothetical protein Pint_20687 [Pistacia integerrima]